MNLTSQQRKIAKWVGYPLLALMTFIFTLAYTFPYERLKDRIIEGLNDKYEVSILSIEPTLIPGTFVINTMMLRTRPKTADEKPVTVVIDKIEVNVGMMSALFWTIDMAKVGVEIEAKIGGGTLELEVEHEKGNNTVAIDARTKMLPLASVPGVADAVGLPMTGGLTASLILSLPSGKWSKADGSLKLSIVGGTVGDGVAKMKMKPQPGARSRNRRRALFQSEGLTVPKLNLGAVLGEVSIKNGEGTIVSMAAKSKDGFLKIEGDIEFKDPFKDSVFPGCMTFGFSDDLKKREPKFMGIEAGLPPKAKQADGSYALPTKGKLVELRFDVRRQCGQSSSKQPGTRERPRITTTSGDDDDTPALEVRKMPEHISEDQPEPGQEDAVPTGESDADVVESGPALTRGLRDNEAAVTGEETEEVEDEQQGGDEQQGDDEQQRGDEQQGDENVEDPEQLDQAEQPDGEELRPEPENDPEIIE